MLWQRATDLLRQDEGQRLPAGWNGIAQGGSSTNHQHYRALDAFTNGGLGIAFLWPFSGERFFAPIHPVEVSPLGLSRFLSSKGVAVLWSEILWIWSPLFAAAAVAAVFRPHLIQVLRKQAV